MKLRSKILLGYSLSLALVVLVGAWGITNLRRLGKASEAILEENYNSILAAENTIDALERQDSAILLFLLENRDRGSQQFRNNQIEFLKWLGRAEGNITIPGEAEIVASIGESYENYLTAFSGLQQEDNPTTEDYYDTIEPIFEDIRDRCAQLRIINQETMEAASENAQEVSQHAIWSMAIAGGVILSPLLALIFYPEEINLAWGLALPGIVLSVVGFLLWRFLAPKKVISLSLAEGSVIVVLAWLIAIAVSMIPFMLIQGLKF